ncbi:MAG: 30S ribosomal protein S17 [Terriglobales bacterium]|jgi:small subunit ribosomal protein S17
MAEITGSETVKAGKQSHRKVLIGTVVSNKMQKTIVVEVTRKKAHPMYKRVISIRKKFYAHDEKNETHPGDVVKIEESRPLSKLKRWTLKEVVRKAALVPEVDIDAGTGVAAKS